MSERDETFQVEETQYVERLDVYLCARYPMASRGALQRMIEEGHIRINGQPVKCSHRPRRGEQLTVHWPDAWPAEAQPENIPLEILFEDPDILVLNKPPGLVVHPAAGNEEHTLVNALLYHCAGRLSGIGGVARPGIVHRLDKDTSGCLVVAKNDEAHHALAEQFENRTIVKIYHAVLCGELSPPAGEIHGAIARHPSHRKRMTVTDGEGRDAWTSYTALERLHSATLVAAQIHTGRTHQIRVHFQHLGFPLVGDVVYGERQNKRLTEQTGYHFKRQLLHSFSLKFVHPRTEKTLTFEASWPADFREAVAALKIGGVV
jgi:23S rRNA pseudouridine1911/1915/1917 synthase